MFANGPGDLGSIPGRVIPKTQKMVLDASLLNIQHYKVRIKGKVEQSREGVAPSPTHWCSSYRKGSLRVTLDYGRQLYLLIYIYYATRKDCVTKYHKVIKKFDKIHLLHFSILSEVKARPVMPVSLSANIPAWAIFRSAISFEMQASKLRKQSNKSI